ncbi:cellulase family glycosylhydrolase [Catenovulum sp. 2E275]|uniref:cellulase family glycosylhydrolase n=1 Tax=Catenovulum sp. 2E275 TaxID=2980497 RepID=UPI0021D2B9FA|nr:cellulase family glycosylhydrolase [Catenovulum sp. 2E275]MCU4674096.1 cellulase family glycosylhydrolase [Catenovulum sp. 2E275]
MKTQLLSLTAAIGLLTSVGASAGFYVQNGNLYEGNGSQFVMRGINHAHTWYTDQLSSSLQGIASYNANTVRVVLSNGHRWTQTSASEVANIIQQAKANELIAVLEVHDTTGYGEDGAAATLSSAVDYWISIKDQLIGQEDYVIINIGNEPFGNNSSASDWINAHNSAISRLRNAGFTHTIMVDAPNWGQDWDNVMRNNASSVFNADPQQNVVFSVHMYEVYQTYSKVNDYISAFTNSGLPLVIGEFGASHKGSTVDAYSIMERSQAHQIGYIGWSWSGNDSTTDDLDIVTNWNTSSLSSWGNILINDSYGIANTSVTASIYSGTGGGNGEYPTCSSTSADPDGDGWGWENNQTCVVGTDDSNNSEYPTCSSSSADPDGDGWGWENNQSCVVGTDSDTTTDETDDTDNPDDSNNSDYPTCSSSSADPDGDGWGWENNQSCVVDSSTDSGSQATHANNGYPYCSSSSVDPDGDGWGWENSTSCVVQGSSADS